MSDAFSNKKVSVIYRITKPFVMIFPLYLAALLVFQRKLDQILSDFWQKSLLVILLVSFIAFLLGIIFRSIRSYKNGYNGLSGKSGTE